MSYDQNSQDYSSNRKRSTNLSSLSAAKHGMLRSSKQSGHLYGQHGSKKAGARLLQLFKAKSAQIDKISLRSKGLDCGQQLSSKHFGVSENPQAKLFVEVLNAFSAATRRCYSGI